MITATPNQADDFGKTVAVGAQALEVSVPIGQGASLSDAIDLRTARLMALWIPAGFSGALLTFQSSADGATFGELNDDTGASVSITIAAGTFAIITKPSQWLGVRWLKVRSGTSGAPSAQAAAATLALFALP